MATPKKGTGSGTSFELSSDNGATWTKFMSVTKVTPPEYTRNTVDLTDNSSFDTNNQMKEFGTSFIEGGDLKVDGFVHVEDKGLAFAETCFYSGEIVSAKLVSPPWLNKTLVYPGVITGLQPIGELDPENGIPYSMTMKVTGKPTVAATKTNEGGGT